MTSTLQRVVVGVDGSDNSRRAIEWAILLAGRFGAEIVAVHAVGLLAHLGEGPPVPSQAHVQELRDSFERLWCSELAGSGVAHRKRCVDGPPARVLLDVADEEGADLIVVGSRGAGGFAGLRLGSTSHQVAEHATCPVAIIPSREEAQN